MGGNVPLNDALAAVHAGSADGATVWARYLQDWTFWNHVRTAASAGTCALYVAALAIRWQHGHSRCNSISVKGA
jgi:uncharacterized membrane protein